MAESTLSTLTDDFLTCNICLEIYEEPKILSCLHSFCIKCLGKHFEKGKDENKMICPLCREITMLREEGVNGLKNNFFIQNLIDFSKSTSTQVMDRMCSYCSLIKMIKPAYGKCLTCSDFLCLECFNRHTFTTETFDHKIATLADLQSGKYNKRLRSSQEIPCQEHRKEFLRYFCETCNVPVCRDCVILEHRYGHDIVQPSKAIEKRRQEIGSLLEGLTKKKEEIKARGAILKEEERRLDVTKSDMSKLIQEAIDRMAKKVQTEGQNAQLLLDSYINKRREELATTRRKQDEKILLLKKSTEFCEKVVRDGIEGEIIFLQEMIRERLSFLDTSVHGDDALTPWVPPTIKISKVVDEILLGDLFRFEESPSLPSTQSCVTEKAVGKDYNQDTYLFGSLPESLAKSCPNLDKVMSRGLKKSKGIREPKENIGDTKVKPSPIRLTQLRVINCKIDGDVNKPKLTSVTWMNEDSFVVVDGTNGKVKQYSVNGELLNSVQMKNVLTLAYSHRFIYCGLNSGQIKVINSKFEIMDLASQKYGYCVPVTTGTKKSRVLLLGSSSMYVVSNDTEISKCIPFIDKSGKQMRLKPMFPNRFHEDKVVVSDWNSGFVCVINTDGRVSAKYQKASDYWMPGGLVCGTENNIYIADYERTELIVLNSNFEYLTTLKLPNIKSPRCMACSDSNKLLIACKDGVAIFQISKERYR